MHFLRPSAPNFFSSARLTWPIRINKWRTTTKTMPSQKHIKMAPNTVLRSASRTLFVMFVLLGHIHTAVKRNITLPFECGPTDCHEYDCCSKEKPDKLSSKPLLNRPKAVWVMFLCTLKSNEVWGNQQTGISQLCETRSKRERLETMIDLCHIQMVCRDTQKCHLYINPNVAYFILFSSQC